MRAFFHKLLIIIVLAHQSLFAGFAAGTLVKTPKGYQTIENINVGDWIYSVTPHKTFKLSQVTHTTSYGLPHAIKIITAPKQKIYLPHEQKWISTKKIQAYHHLATAQNTITQNFKIVQQKEVTHFFDIRLHDIHTFCVGTDEIVVHNFPLFFIGFTIAWGTGTIVLDGIYCGICIAGLWFGTKLLKHNNSDNSNKKFQIQPFISPPNTPDPDDDWFEKLKKNHKRKAYTKKFGNIYQDHNTKLWYSKDRAGIRAHGGEHYKVFKETTKGFEYAFQLDKFGNEINKHKGPIGIFIPYNTIIFTQ